MEQDIDLVVPMVFPDDAEWRRTFARYHGGDSRQHVRFRSWGTEELLVRCCMEYMPWLHRIFILLAGESQRQPWMDDYPKVTVVCHDQFIPRKRLPCFSSPCIEMFLKDIPGLSEQFIYANDDMFPLSPLRPDDFFRDGKPCIHFSEKQFPKAPNVFQRKCLYQQNMVGAPFGKQYRRTWIASGHSFAPILRSACEAVWQRHGTEINKYLSPLRRTDHSYNHYVYLLYQHYAGLCADHAPRCQYAGEDTPTAKLPAIIADPEAGIVCLNDNENIQDWQHRATIVREAVARKLGAPTVAIVHYNTPKLTQCCIRSLLKHTQVGRIVVFDNSDRLPFMMKNVDFCNEHPGLIEVVDNTHGQKIDFDKWIETFPDREPPEGNDYGSPKHCYSIQWLCDYIGEPFVLMDSDVLIKRDIKPFLEHPDCAWVGEAGENVRLRFGYDFKRLLPFLCWLNVPLLKQHGISYFNGEYMWRLTHKEPNHRYDTGAWLYRAVGEAGLPVRRLRLDDYIVHLGHASWRNRNPMDWLRIHRSLWE